MAYYFRKHSDLISPDLHICWVQLGLIPPAAVTPSFIGQLYIDTNLEEIYIAKSLVTGNYEPIGSAALYNLLPFPDTLAGDIGTAVLAARGDHVHPFSSEMILRDGTVAFTGDESMGGKKLTNLAAPVAGTDATNKTYVDTQDAGVLTTVGLNYLKLNGTNQMAADLNFGWNKGVNCLIPTLTGDVANKAYVDSVAPIAAPHAATHLPNAIIDPLTVAVPTDIGIANAIGVANSFNHSDHVHNHPNLGDLHTGYVLADGTRAFTGAESMGGFKITSLATCTAGTDAVNKSYVDTTVAAISGAVTSDYFKLDQTTPQTVTGIPEFPCLVLTDHVMGTPQFTEVGDFMNLMSGGRITGGELSDDGVGGVNISPLQGMIRTLSASVTGEIKFFEMGAANIAAGALTTGVANWVYCDYNGGVPQYLATTSRTSVRLTDQFILGRVFPEVVGDVEALTAGETLPNFIRNEVDRTTYRGTERMTGGVIGQSGVRYLTATAGTFYLGCTRILTSAKDTSAGDTFEYFYKDGVGGWTQVAGGTQVNNTNYDDGDGTLGTLTNTSRYNVFWVYICNEGDIYLLYHNQTVPPVGGYTLAQAQAIVELPTSIPPYLADFATLAAKLIIQKSAASIHTVQSAYTAKFVPSTVNNHNDLANLDGGTTDEYYHFTNTQHTDLTDGGDSALHYHATDRARANHTGTQLSSTISDLDVTIDAAVTTATENLSGNVETHFLKLDGTSTMQGELDFGWNKGVSCQTPTITGDVANKKYVDDAIDAIPAGGGAKTSLHFTAGGATLPNSNFAEPNKIAGTNWVFNVIAFDQTTDEAAYFYGSVPDGYAGGSLKISLYARANANSGTALMKVVTRYPSHDEVWDATGTPSTVETAIDCLAAGTAYDLMVDSGTWSANLPTATDALQIKVYRDADASGGGTDDLAADYELIAMRIEEV